ncbi:hypothetical protein QS817_06490 [Providencia rettgeri]|nr:hypothetical protein [Providencia rettgeri]MDL9982860.1 hypothetical protein [Providencia rettgeri]
METQLKENKVDLRDYFAAKCMQGDFAAQSNDINGSVYSNDLEDHDLDDCANFYYRMADAMLKARGWYGV